MGLLDRSSAPVRCRIAHREERVEAIAALRRLRMTAAEIAETLSMPLSTVSAVLTRIGLGKLSRLEPPEPANRYERKRPGELLHIDVKKLGRIGRPGHRVNGDRTHPDSRGDRLGVRPRLRRRRDPARLRRGARRREGRPPRPASCAAPSRTTARHGIQVERVMTDNGSCLPLDRARARLQGTRDPAPPHPPLPATHQRQSRTLHPHDARRLGLRRHLPHLRRTPRSPRRLARLLQSPTTTRQPRPPTATTAAGGPHQEQPCWVLQLVLAARLTACANWTAVRY